MVIFHSYVKLPEGNHPPAIETQPSLSKPQKNEGSPRSSNGCWVWPPPAPISALAPPGSDFDLAGQSGQSQPEFLETVPTLPDKRLHSELENHHV